MMMICTKLKSWCDEIRLSQAGRRHCKAPSDVQDSAPNIILVITVRLWPRFKYVLIRIFIILVSFFYTNIFRYLFVLLFKHIYFATSWSQCPSSSFLDFSLPDLIWKRSVSSQHNKEKLCSVDEWVPCYKLLCQLLDLGSPVRLSCQSWVNRVSCFLHGSDIASNGWVKEKKPEVVQLHL